jgi:putative ABC transport system permease protein
LIILEIAATCAIVSNTVFLVQERLSRIDTSSGIVEEEVVRVQLTGIGEKPDADAATTVDLSALRAIPGVQHVATTNMVPFGNSSWNSTASATADDPNGVNSAMYFGSQDLLETMGVQLTAGRDFTPGEYVSLQDVQGKRTQVSAVIITRGLSNRIFPGKNPIGQPLYALGKDPQTVVGVIDHLARPNEGAGRENSAYAMMFPITAPYTVTGNYLLRTSADQVADVLAAIDATLNGIDRRRIILERQAFAEIRREYFAQDRSLALLLAGVSIALLVVTALGIVGLASFWVQQRTRQIGIRRALGATRGDILRYFQLENFILATVGIVLGMVLSYAINLWLIRSYQVARLPGTVLPIGAVLLWLVGQLAVLGPALRATRISPAIATRSV